MLLSRSQLMRRAISSFLIAILLGLVYLGLEVVPPFRQPGWFAALWLIAGGNILFLVALALLDLRELHASRDIASALERLRFESRPSRPGQERVTDLEGDSGASQPPH